LNVLEDNIFKDAISFAKDKLQKELFSLINAKANKLDYCSSCSGELSRNGYSTKSITTSLGIINVKLVRKRCKMCNKSVLVGNDLLPKDGITTHLSEKICDLSSQMSFESVSQSLHIQHKVFLSTDKIHKHVKFATNKMVDVNKEQAEIMFTNARTPERVKHAPKVLYVGIDGGFVNRWKGKRKHFEIKAITLATGVRRVKKRYELVNRIGYANAVSSDKFGQIVANLIYKNTDDNTRVIVVSDGAKWIRNVVESWIPNSIHLLDLFHLKQKVYRAFSNDITHDMIIARDGIIDLIDNYDGQGVLDALEKIIPPKDRTDKFGELYSYVFSNLDTISNHKDQIIHGSGYIEKGVDLMISRRLKMRGMGWKENGANAMLKLTLLRYNKQWDDYWRQSKNLALVV
jgi:transposase-like protein